MKKLLILAFITPICSRAQTGTVTGNVYWKYNSYIGNKADAGALVYLFQDSSQPRREAECDLQGNFKFDNLKPGEYLVLIQSKNTTDDWQSNFIRFKFNRLHGFTGFDDNLLDKSIYDSIENLRSYYVGTIGEKYSGFAINKHLKKIEKARQDYTAAIRRVFRNIGQTDPLYMFIGVPLQYPRKIEIKRITVLAAQSSSIVVDFGTTYI